MGPVIGSFFFNILDYEGTMYLFAGFDLVATILCIILIPNALNVTLSDEEIEEIEYKDDANLD